MILYLQNLKCVQNLASDVHGFQIYIANYICEEKVAANVFGVHALIRCKFGRRSLQVRRREVRKYVDGNKDHIDSSADYVNYTADYASADDSDTNPVVVFQFFAFGFLMFLFFVYYDFQ